MINIPVNIDDQLRLLDKFKIDYKDPGNFIYIFNNHCCTRFPSCNTDQFTGLTGRCPANSVINEYINTDNTYKYKEILELYLKYYYIKIISWENRNVTSFPIYPNMEECSLSYSQLTTFPIQPNMEKCHIGNNQLITFSIQPNMKECYLSNNKFTEFSIQPKMEDCYLDDNQLTIFPIQPNMRKCHLSNNQLTTFPIQPNMEDCYFKNNRLTTFPIQPNMRKCHLSNNQLTTFPIQPNMEECVLFDNKLKLFPTQPEMTYCNITNNELTNFSFQPKMITFYRDEITDINPRPQFAVVNDNTQVIIRPRTSSQQNIQQLPSRTSSQVNNIRPQIPSRTNSRQNSNTSSRQQVNNIRPQVPSRTNSRQNSTSSRPQVQNITSSRSQVNNIRSQVPSRTSSRINIPAFLEEEDSDDFTNVITYDSDSITYDISSCPNNDLITLEPYDITLNDVFTIYYLNSMKKFSTGSCISKSQMKDYIKSEDDESPSLLSTIWKGGDKTGVGGKPTCKFIIKMPPNNLWITLGSFDKMMNSSEKKWYLLPLYSNKRRRIGYKYGISANHGQIPGSYIYKSFTKKEIMENTVVKETDYDFPLYLRNVTLSELDLGKIIIKSIKNHFK